MALVRLIHAVFGHRWHWHKPVNDIGRRRCYCGAEIPPNRGEWT